MSEIADTFEESILTPGVETLIWLPAGRAIIGVIATVDAEARSVTFADGRTHVFPPVAVTKEDVP